VQIAQGKKHNNNLYKMDVQLYKEGDGRFKGESFMGNKSPASWETWHRRFGHIGYTGLQKLLDGNLVEGFEVDTNTLKPDCITCTEAKQHIEPFPKSVNQHTKPGELTHIDL
jgi:GAG-pre-integrase domain